MKRIASACAVLIGVQTTRAGFVVLSGDVTPVFSLTDNPNGTIAPGNQLFFAKLLGNGAHVAIRNSNYSTFCGPLLSDFYGGLPGVSATTISGSITASELAGVDLLAIPFQSADLATPEVQAIRSFLDAGGSLFVTAESDGIGNAAQSVTFVNHSFANLGISLRVTTTSYDIGPRVASGPQIASQELLTADIGQFQYGYAAAVTGGRPLFRTSNLTTFIAVLPEPAMAAGLTLVPIVLRRRRAIA